MLPYPDCNATLEPKTPLLLLKYVALGGHLCHCTGCLVRRWQRCRAPGKLASTSATEVGRPEVPLAPRTIGGEGKGGGGSAFPPAADGGGLGISLAREGCLHVSLAREGWLRISLAREGWLGFSLAREVGLHNSLACEGNVTTMDALGPLALL